VLQGARRLVLDPNALSPDGAVSLSEFAPSPDARLLAYTLAEGGADWQMLKVRVVATGREMGVVQEHDECWSLYTAVFNEVVAVGARRAFRYPRRKQRRGSRVCGRRRRW
jgi:prolyl oligopeptidase PreP (S9A serine peptidase family)